MLATLRDVSAGSRRGFAREISDLVRLGLRTRASSTASVGARRLVADGLCLAAAWLMTLDVSTLLSQRARGMHDPLLSAPSIALLAAVLALAFIGYDRLAGAGALVWTALRLPALWDHHAGLVRRRGRRRAAADRPTPGDRGRRLGQQPTTTARSFHACSSPPARSSSPPRSPVRAGCVAPRPSSRAPALPTPNPFLGLC